MSYVIFVAPESSAQADTILVGPFRYHDRAEEAMERIERRYGESVACMVMELTPPSEIGTMFG